MRALYTLTFYVTEGGAVDGDPGIGIAHKWHIVILAGHFRAKLICKDTEKKKKKNMRYNPLELNYDCE